MITREEITSRLNNASTLEAVNAERKTMREGIRNACSQEPSGSGALRVLSLLEGFVASESLRRLNEL